MTWNPAPAALATIVPLLQETAPAAAAASSAIVERKLHFLVAAYSVVWLILAVYLLSLSVRLRRLSAAVRRLRERLGL